MKIGIGGDAFEQRTKLRCCPRAAGESYQTQITRDSGRAGSDGHTLGGAVGLVMGEAQEPINPAFITDGTWEIEIAGKNY
ncbi:MAG: hypothetical protein K2W91_14650, partial [Novosphingobium sp.]|nr:hypothetical protein [Novosphingobium sp.]